LQHTHKLLEIIRQYCGKISGSKNRAKPFGAAKLHLTEKVLCTIAMKMYDQFCRARQGFTN